MDSDLTDLAQQKTKGMPMVFFMYAFITLLEIAVVVVLLPETKGKTFDEIQEFFNKKPRIAREVTTETEPTTNA
jgi:hypothetical protein